MTAWEEVTGYRRNTANDMESERKPVKPPKMAPQKQHAASTGFTSQVAGLMTDSIVEQAVADRMALAQAEAEGAEEPGTHEEEAEADTAAHEDDDAKAGDDDDLEALRARRRQQMKKRFEQEQEYKALGHGAYDEIVEEEFLKTVTSSKRCVVHFHHRNFERCKIMDMHLQRCARRFVGTRFVKLDSEKAPFFVQKLQVKTLPCAIVFVDGISTGRQMGFNGLPGGDEFRTAELAWALKGHGGIEEEFGQDDDIE